VDCPGVADLGDAGGVDAGGDVEGDERPDPGERNSGDEEAGDDPGNGEATRAGGDTGLAMRAEAVGVTGGESPGGERATSGTDPGACTCMGGLT
jgi:hypothetical protein